MNDKSLIPRSTISRCQVHLIVSLDYEIFGNGSGRVDCCVIRPTDAIARLVESFGGRLSVFVDTCEFQAMAADASTAPAAAAVTRQLRALAIGGHHLQLHLHPQWTGEARFVDGRWSLALDRWRVGNCSVLDLQTMVDSGLAWLEQLSGESHGSKRPIAFRAGGWCVQPSSNLICVLTQHGFSVDSSVAPSLWSSARGSWYDFREHPGLPTWPVADDVCGTSVSGMIWEVPIAVGRISRLGHLRSIARSRGRFAVGCQGTYSRGETKLSQLSGQVSRLRQLGRAMLDFSTLDGPALIAVAEDWLQAHAHSEAVIPLVAIGHAKNFTADSMAALRQFLTWATNDYRVSLSDYSSVMEAIRARN